MDDKLWFGLEKLAEQEAAANAVQPGMIAVDVISATGNGADILPGLVMAGLQDPTCLGAYCSGMMAADDLLRINDMENVLYAVQGMSLTNVGSVENQAVYSLNVAQSWDVFGTRGAGVKIGVISDSFDLYGSLGREDDYARDISTGDLPDDIVVLQDSDVETNIDEGRAMMQLVYDIAPEAELYFHTADYTKVDFANAIRALAERGCSVIVDDMTYFEEPMYMDGVIAQAVDEVTEQGVVYFAAAGNDGREAAYEAAFTPSGQYTAEGGVLHDFDPGPGVDVTQTITVDNKGETYLFFQWDQPFFSATGGQAASSNDLDIFIYDQEGNLVAESVENNVGADPAEVVTLPALDGEEATYSVQISLEQGAAPSLMKWLSWGISVTIDEYATYSPTIFSHAAAAGSVSVGAAPWSATPAYGEMNIELEEFSSDGPMTILFDDQGNRLAEPEIRNAPLLTAVDATYTTFFGRETDEGDYAFKGTSAAAPNAAAVAALMRSVAPEASRGDIVQALTATAVDMYEPGYDYDSGYGLVQADDALAYVTQGADFSPVYEVSLGEASLWTDSRDEKLNVMSGQIWSYDGIGFGEAVGNDAIPTYRFYSAATNDHFLTTSASERDNVLATMSELYAYEGESFSVYASEQEGTTELYRFCNPQNMLHVYTADAQELSEMLAQPQFNYEGVMGWVEPLMV